MFSPCAAHENSRDTNGFADFCDFLVQFTLIVRNLRLLLFEGVNSGDKLR